MSSPPAYIERTGVICPIGIGAAQASASFRAGLSAFEESSIHDPWFEPVRMALLAEDALAPLADTLEDKGLTAQKRRMLRLLGVALASAADGLQTITQTPLFLGLPAQHPDLAVRSYDGFLEHVRTQSQVAFDLTRSMIFSAGRAAGLLALEAALEALSRGTERAIVAGVDTFLDLRLLATLHQEGRVLGPRITDGFVPGEGAACLVLVRHAPANQAAIRVRATGTASDLGHRYGSEPALGEGLSNAIEALRAKEPHLLPVQTCFAGLNGESFGAKEWGVARIRQSDLFATDLSIEHPADCFGDVGAAIGPLLLALADETLRAGDKEGPVLVWASSDTEPCGCVYLELG